MISYTEQQLKELDTATLYDEMADMALIDTPESYDYYDLLIAELKKRNNS